jgi:hypothetical protein
MTIDSSPPIAADVLLRSVVSAADERDVMEAFSAIGVAATIRFAPTRRRLDGVEWLVLAALPLQAFLSGLGSKLAEDVHGGLKNAVGRILHCRSEPARHQPTLVLQDTASGVQIVLEPELPIQAYKCLLQLDLPAFRHGSLHYDRDSGAWQSVDR